MLVSRYNGRAMPDLVAGKEYDAEVSILKQDYSSNPDWLRKVTEGTDPDASVKFQFNDQVLTVNVSTISSRNKFS